MKYFFKCLATQDCSGKLWLMTHHLICLETYQSTIIYKCKTPSSNKAEAIVLKASTLNKNMVSRSPNQVRNWSFLLDRRWYVVLSLKRLQTIF